jgi:SAM-dependent methyltransferase
MNHDALPRLYTDLASWFHLLTPPDEYKEEAAIYRQMLVNHCSKPPKTVLELGSGGGNNASHLKEHFQMTLVDLSSEMLDISRPLNPECEHLQGDMRSVRLGREFDAVFVHDAVCYMTSEDDLRRAIETAFRHCASGGATLFVPDYVRENFREQTDHGGHDEDGRALRYLEWTRDTDNTDCVYEVDFAYLLVEEGQPASAVHDHHVEGLFSREIWMRLLTDVGFEAHELPFLHSEVPIGSVVFVGVKP